MEVIPSRKSKQTVYSQLSKIGVDTDTLRYLDPPMQQLEDLYVGLVYLKACTMRSSVVRR
jgi:hypothetical protein